jgi:hypothetical protein
VDNMFVGLEKKDGIIEDVAVEEKFIEEKVEDLPKPKTTKRGRPKKPATEKQKAHLAKIREKALATRRKNSEMKKQAVLDTEKKIKEGKRKKKVEVAEEPELEPLPQQSATQKISELENNDFQKFLNNMNKFMVLQEQHEAKQRNERAKVEAIRLKQQKQREAKQREAMKKQQIQRSQPQPVPQKPQRQFIPGVNAPMIQPKNPYDDYFG